MRQRSQSDEIFVDLLMKLCSKILGALAFLFIYSFLKLSGRSLLTAKLTVLPCSS